MEILHLEENQFNGKIVWDLEANLVSSLRLKSLEFNCGSILKYFFWFWERLHCMVIEAILFFKKFLWKTEHFRF